jgi:branched-chain amino acid transport system substrate-binding protein
MFMKHLTAILRTLSCLLLGVSCAWATAQPALDCGANTGHPATATAAIALGAIVGKTGPDDFSASAAAAAAYFRCVNENGGIHGHPIEYSVIDDQWNPQRAAQAARTLIEERKVLAMVGSSSFVECSVNAKHYADAGLMVIAGTGVPRECFHTKAYVPVNSGPRLSSTLAAMYAAKTNKVSRMVCIIPNIPGLGDWACNGVRDWGQKKGIKVLVITLEPAQFSAREVMGRAAAFEPDVIVMNLSKGILLPMMAAAQQMDLGQRIRFVSSAPAYNPEVARALGPYWKGNFFANLEFMPLDHPAPDTRNWQAVMDRYGAKTDSRDAFSQGGYLAARLLTQTLLKMPGDKIDRAGVTQALQQVQDFRSDLLCKPFYVGKGARHNANISGPMAAFDGLRWEPLPGGCSVAEDPELADLKGSDRR